MMKLSSLQANRLGEWRREVLHGNHLLPTERMREIEAEIQTWDSIVDLKDTSKFFELFDQYDAQGHKSDVQGWRGVFHWLWIRHASVHALFVLPNELFLLQRRSSTVENSPNFTDISVAGHLGTSDPIEALRSESLGELGIDLSPNSKHILDSNDLKPIQEYEYVEPPRPAIPFYNIERRFVFLIRLSATALADLRFADGEVGSLVLAPLQETWELVNSPISASALRVSGPMALHYFMTQWQ